MDKILTFWKAFWLGALIFGILGYICGVFRKKVGGLVKTGFDWLLKKIGIHDRFYSTAGKIKSFFKKSKK